MLKSISLPALILSATMCFGQEPVPELIPCTNPQSWNAQRTYFKGCINSTRAMILLNGTNAPCGFYRRVIDAAVGRGYFVACPQKTWTGTGQEGADAFDYLLDIGFQFEHVLVTGHSQGGGGTIGTTRILNIKNPDVTVDMLPIMPAFWMTPYFKDRAPKLVARKKLVACGNRDTTVPCDGVYDGFLLLQDPKEFRRMVAGHLNPQREWIMFLEYFQ